MVGNPAIQYTMSLTCIIYVPHINFIEAAVIIAHSDDLSLDRLLVNDSTILLMCAAYGVPLPIITWTSPSQGIVDYSTTNTSVSRYATVNSTVVEDKITNLSIVVSVLELCVLDEQNTTIVCEASNGIDVENPIGVSAIIFGRRLITTEKVKREYNIVSVSKYEMSTYVHQYMWYDNIACIYMQYYEGSE